MGGNHNTTHGLVTWAGQQPADYLHRILCSVHSEVCVLSCHVGMPIYQLLISLNQQHTSSFYDVLELIEMGKNRYWLHCAKAVT